MDTKIRREHIRKDLEKTNEAISASKLSKKYNVSRQVIVGDVAILKAQGEAIVSTARGYIVAREHDGNEYTIACIHEEGNMERELRIIVDQGAIVKDVIVEHPMYGDLNGKLNIASRYDIEQFIQKSKEKNAKSLSEMNNGLHLHTVICTSEEQFKRVENKLDEEGFLYK